MIINFLFNILIFLNFFPYFLSYYLFEFFKIMVFKYIEKINKKIKNINK